MQQKKKRKPQKASTIAPVARPGLFFCFKIRGLDSLDIPCPFDIIGSVEVLLHFYAVGSHFL